MTDIDSYKDSYKDLYLYTLEDLLAHLLYSLNDDKKRKRDDKLKNINEIKNNNIKNNPEYKNIDNFEKKIKFLNDKFNKNKEELSALFHKNPI